MAPSVKVKLQLDGTPEAVAALRAFSSQAKAAGKEATGGFAGFNAAIGSVGKVLAAVGIAKVIKDIGDFTAETIRAAAEQKDLALSLGTTIGHFSALSAIAKATNTDQNEMVSAFSALGDRIDDLRKGLPEATAAFGRLRNAQGQALGARDFMSNDIVVNAETLAQSLSRVEDGMTKSAIAADVMGKKGRALLPVFEKLVEVGGIAGAVDFAKKTGFYVDAANIALLDQLQARLAIIQLHARGVALQFAQGFGPDVVASLGALTTSMGDTKSAAQAFGEVVGWLVRGFARLIIHTRGWVEVLGNVMLLRFDVAIEQFKKYDKLLKDFDADKGTVAAANDAVGNAAAQQNQIAVAAAARARKELLAAGDQYQDDRLKMLKSQWQAEEGVDAERYKKGLLSLDAYNEARRKRVEAEFAWLVARKQKERDLVANPDSALGRFEVETINNELTVLYDQRTKALSDAIVTVHSQFSSLRDDLRGSFTSAMSNFLGSTINNVRSLADAFRQLGLTIAQAVQQALAMRIATKISDFVFAGPVTAKAAGGLITGPGGPTSDLIPARLSAGEYVLPARVVSQPGMLATLEGLRSGRFGIGGLGAQLVSGRRYADGGLVAPMGAAEATIGGQVTVALDDGLVVKALESPEGQSALLRVVGRNRRAIGRVLG